MRTEPPSFQKFAAGTSYRGTLNTILSMKNFDLFHQFNKDCDSTLVSGMARMDAPFRKCPRVMALKSQRSHESTVKG